MHIVFNCIDIKPSYVGGINTFTLGLLDGFTACGAGHNHLQVSIAVTEKNKHLFTRFEPACSLIVLTHKAGRLKAALRYFVLATTSQRLYYHYCRIAYAGLARMLNKTADAVYIPTTVLFPYGLTIPTLVSMHDIQHVHFPHFFNVIQLISRIITFSITTRHTTMFQASSQFLKHDLLKNLPGIDDSKVTVIREGVTIGDFQKIDRAINVREIYGLDESYLFFPAQLWPHKNHITVLKALLILKKKYGLCIQMVMTGQIFSAGEEIFSFIKDNHLDTVRYLGKVPFSHLAALYQNARAFITAVLYESSSLPILEAAGAGTAILASDTPPNREMSEVLSINLFPPEDEISLAAVLNNVWNDDSLRRKQIAANKKAIEYYAWKNVAAEYIRLIENMIQNEKSRSTVRL